MAVPVTGVSVKQTITSSVLTSADGTGATVPASAGTFPVQDLPQPVQWNAGNFGNLVKMMNAEKIQLEEELRHAEEDEMKDLLEEQVCDPPYLRT